MPFRLLKKKDKTRIKSAKERPVVLGKYTKREDTAEILQEKLKKSVSSPNLLEDLTASSSALPNASATCHSNEDATHQDAGILMIGNGQAIHLNCEIQTQPGISADNSYVNESNHCIDSSKQYVVFEPCEVCNKVQGIGLTHGQLNAIEQGYRHPPTYAELIQQKPKPLLDKYKHPPPYRETRDAHLSFNDLYSGGISSDERNDLIYRLMTNKTTGMNNSLNDGYSQSQPCLPSTSFAREAKGVKIDKETMTDLYLYPEGKSPENVTNYSLYASHATVMTDPYTYNQRLLLQEEGSISYHSPEQSQIVPSNCLYSSSGSAMATSCPSFYNRNDIIAEQMVNNNCVGFPALHPGIIPGNELDNILPPGWEAAVSPDGRKYYIDHHTKTTAWRHPIHNEDPPDGWERVESHHGVCYFNHQRNIAQHEHPGQEQYIKRYKQEQLNLQPESKRVHIQDDLSHNAFVNGEIPTWLMIYAHASPEYDGFLKWELFRYSELDCWQTILKRLFKKEVEQIVMRYEEYRQALQREIERRQKQKRLSSQALADYEKESDV